MTSGSELSKTVGPRLVKYDTDDVEGLELESMRVAGGCQGDVELQVTDLAIKSLRAIASSLDAHDCGPITHEPKSHSL